MRLRVSFCRKTAWLALPAVLVLVLCAPASAQRRIAIPGPPAEMTQWLDRGLQLESAGQWGEAVSHYEKALRRFPRDPGLEQHFNTSRLHYNLTRRYADDSFVGIIGRLSLDDALTAYESVLQKIETHYVETPHWRSLVDRGTDCLEVALSERAFLASNLPGVGADRLEAFRLTLRSMLASRTLRSRQDAREAVSAAADLAAAQLGLSAGAVVLEYTCGAAAALDHYSTYLTPAQLTEIYAQIEGNFVGLGIELKMEQGSLVIVRVIPNSPASAGGLHNGDHVLAVDGQSTRELSLDRAANLLQGKEGTIVEVTTMTPGGQPRTLSIRRQHVEVPSVDKARIVDAGSGVAYLRLTCFQKTTCRDLDAALWELYRAGMRSLIIDLRGNPGGLLVTSVDVADKFVDQGTIVSTRGRSAREDFTYSAHANGTWRVPLIVLIDGDSASAAEIFAGAIRDHRRGTIVGQRSYGKGSVQGIFPLGRFEAGLRLTTARFYSPNGRAYSRVGVEPDVIVRQAAKPVDGSPVAVADDAVLRAALEMAQQQLAQR
ncbi:MAG: PDZ domain-containing protein [Planctomycetes bacterium]|nr:PDZ domain-containing protein [Planctomycetota bacterium]